MAEAKKKSAPKKTDEEVIIAGETAETAVAPANDKEDVKTAKPTAKAGKRSAKAMKEAEEKQAKEDRKVQAAETEEVSKPKVAQKPARPKHERKGKKYQEAFALVESGKLYSIKDALELAAKTSTVKFDATVEIHVNLGVDPRQADQNVRDTVVLPAGTGKTVCIAVFADPDGVAAATKAGADIAASDEFLQQLDKGTIDFDVLIATPAMMPKLGKYARLLGPKGLMPNPKSGTVTTDITKAVSEAKSGKLEYRVDSTGIVHVATGKISFGTDKLLQNVQAVMSSIKSNKPASLKSAYVKSIHVTTTMGPSIPVDTAEINNL